MRRSKTGSDTIRYRVTNHLTVLCFNYAEMLMFNVFIMLATDEKMMYQVLFESASLNLLVKNLHL